MGNVGILRDQGRHERRSHGGVAKFTERPGGLVADAPLGIGQRLQERGGGPAILDLSQSVSRIGPDIVIPIREGLNERPGRGGILDGAEGLGRFTAHLLLRVFECTGQGRHGRTIGHAAQDGGSLPAN